MIVALDIETKCGVPGCVQKGCYHPLISHQAAISCIGIYTSTQSRVFRDLDRFKAFLDDNPDIQLIGHNLKFDLRVLDYHGVKIPASQWVADTQLMASVCLDKVTQDYLDWYSIKRSEKNKLLPKGQGHREGKPRSLKVLAPFFLGIPPFWEDPTNHDSDEYVLKDCEYTYKLYQFFEERLKAQDLHAFFYTKMMPWSRMILEAELRGITVDVIKLEADEFEATQQEAALKAQLDDLWAPAYEAHRELEKELLWDKYVEMMRVQATKRGIAEGQELPEKLFFKYMDLYKKAKEKLPQTMNLNSPKQLAWILKDFYNLNITDFEGDESTGKAVLQTLAAKGREDIKTFLDYRAQSKLVTAFFPTYRELLRPVGKTIHPVFNIDGTRTGRLSCQDPNLQQVPGSLHKLFIARPGYKLISRDMSAIEAKLIAYFSEDKVLFDIVNSGADFHGTNAKLYFGLDCDSSEVKEKYPKERKMAKEVGFALFYGAGANRLKAVSQKHGYEWSDTECKKKVEAFRELYKGVFEYKAQIDLEALEHPIANIFGRLSSYPDPTEIMMKAFNTQIQGSASDMVLEGTYRTLAICDQENLFAHPLLWVHDEVVLEAPAGVAKIVDGILAQQLTGFQLKTKHGLIKLESEGKVSDRWEK